MCTGKLKEAIEDLQKFAEMYPGHEGIDEKIEYLQEQMVSQNIYGTEKEEENKCKEHDIEHHSDENQSREASDSDEASTVKSFKVCQKQYC